MLLRPSTTFTFNTYGVLVFFDSIKKKVADSVKIGFQCYTPQVFDYSLVFFFFSSRNRDFGIDFCFSRPPPSSSTAAVSNFIFLFCCCCWCALAVALPSPRSSFLPPPPPLVVLLWPPYTSWSFSQRLGGVKLRKRDAGLVAWRAVLWGWGGDDVDVQGKL